MDYPNGISLPSLVSDGMVLQHDGARVWGRAPSGSKVRVDLCGRSWTATAGPDGAWIAELGALPPGGPFTMTIGGSIRLSDIWIGEVWICGGQSNMEIPLERTYPWPGEAKEHPGSPAVRQFRGPVQAAFDGPRAEIAGGAWSGADSERIKDFSALAYSFALELRKARDLPVGIVNIGAGGAPAQSFLSAQAIDDFPAYAWERKLYADDSYRGCLADADRIRQAAWRSDLDLRDSGLAALAEGGIGAWISAGGGSVNVPVKWKDCGIGDICGSVWFRRVFELPPERGGKPARLRLGCMVDSDDAYLNGVKAGSTGYQYPPRRYDVAPGLLRAGTNELVVRMIAPEGSGGFVAGKDFRLEYPDGTVDLRGAWEYRLGARSGFLAPQTFFQYKPTALFNGFIAPTDRLAAKGILWYQGESNESNAGDYRELVSAMVKEWRARRGEPDLPFLFVQLPLFGTPSSSCEENGRAEIRDQQRRCLDLPRTGMAVSLDLGEWNDLHPLRKAELGKRLAVLAEEIAYGGPERPGSGPLPRSCHSEGGGLRIRFSRAGAGLRSVDGLALGHFFLRAGQGGFLPAEASADGDSVLVRSAAVSDPQEVRYAWAGTPLGANLCDSEGIPASPFQLRVPGTR
jgi:sialate O-acetylesterase